MFAINVVRLYQYLCKEHKEFVLSKQFRRSGTSIGANMNESQAAQSRKYFIAKMAIASKEARESFYWLELLVASDYLNSAEERCVILQNQCQELIRLITSIVKSSQASLKG